MSCARATNRVVQVVTVGGRSFHSALFHFGDTIGRLDVSQFARAGTPLRGLLRREIAAAMRTLVAKAGICVTTGVTVSRARLRLW